MGNRSSQNGLVTIETCCFVHNVVQLTSSGLLACHIFGPSGNARTVDIVELSLSKMVSLQRKSERIMGKGPQKNKSFCALKRRFKFLFCCHVSAPQVFLSSSKPTALSPLLLLTVSTGSLIETPFTQESRLKALRFREFFLGGRILTEFLRKSERRLLPPKLRSLGL